MKVIQIAPKDIFITLEISLTEAENLLIALENAIIEYDGKNDIKVVKAVKYLTEDFQPTLDKIVEDLKR